MDFRRLANEGTLLLSIEDLQKTSSPVNYTKNDEFRGLL